MNEGFNRGSTTYGGLLGDYFATVQTIGEMEKRFEPAVLDEHETYQRLLIQREAIRERLDEVAHSRADSDIKQLLDEAFAEE